ncbi:hypothetical protein DCAR_0209291 [Daucus carota subsp. sativus]|uniref:Uncharacterized protein n=1 Tax=Daucus carota subsp. sativus TaxID=79200 RepID=A0A161XJF0_DAUCS|nr:hypothetical protein DCAR_0209291 [Daucus carota subsp. sativus]
MTYHNSAKPVIATLALLFASLPLSHARTARASRQARGSNTGIAICIMAARPCTARASPSGNLPAPGSGSLGAGGTLVSGSCNGATGDIGTTALSNTGLLRAVYSLPFSNLFDSVAGSPCNFTVKLPAAGTTCEMFPPRGVLKAGIKLDRLNVDAAGEIMAEAGLLPFRYLPDE